MEKVILVDSRDCAIGEMEKLCAHRGSGHLHRAFSVLIFEAGGERQLLQQRAAGKYHFPGLWSNACCGHPRPGETNLAAATRRVTEELNLDVELNYGFCFHYEAQDDGAGLIEREMDHVFWGYYKGPVHFEPSEIKEVRWVEPHDLERELKQDPSAFTPWFKLIVDEWKKRALT